MLASVEQDYLQLRKSYLSADMKSAARIIVSRRILEILESAGAKIFLNHDPGNFQNPDLVIRSSAVPDENVEVQAALKRRIPVLKRADFLPELIGNKKCIAVSGTHGKTTITSMIAWVLVSLGLDPSYILGSISINLGNNAHEGEGEFFIIEADEYDNMFLGLHPDIAVVTSIEHDHPDFFPTYDELFQAFVKFFESC